MIYDINIYIDIIYLFTCIYIDHMYKYKYKYKIQNKCASRLCGKSNLSPSGHISPLGK